MSILAQLNESGIQTISSVPVCYGLRVSRDVRYFYLNQVLATRLSNPVFHYVKELMSIEGAGRSVSSCYMWYSHQILTKSSGYTYFHNPRRTSGTFTPNNAAAPSILTTLKSRAPHKHHYEEHQYCIYHNSCNHINTALSQCNHISQLFTKMRLTYIPVLLGLFLVCHL